MQVLKKLASNDDNKIMSFITTNYIDPYLDKFPNNNITVNHDKIILRLSRLCPEFNAISYRISENKGNWVLLKEKPETNLNEKTCADFFLLKTFQYLEPSGDTVTLQFEDGNWIDRFIDGTYSKLKIIEKSNCEFDIQFIESNNFLRSNFSKEGERYSYKILDLIDNKYFLSVKIPDQDQYFKFILYPKN